MLHIDIQGLHKWYGPFHVLRGVDLQVRRGERIVVCGPSGSGKSTLLRCVNRLETYEQGRIVVDGIELNGHPSHTERIRRRVGMVFQQLNLFPHLTVLDNCTVAPICVDGLLKRDAENVAMHYLRRVRIAEQAHKYPGQLSAGQRQRAAIARALAMNPQIVLLDDPTSALDAEMVKEVLDSILVLAEDGITVVCITQEMRFARRIADRVVFMEGGRVVEENAAAAFFAEPQRERTRRFLGQLMRVTPA